MVAFDGQSCSELYVSSYITKDACFVAEQLAVWFILSEFVLATDGYSFIVGLK